MLRRLGERQHRLEQLATSRFIPADVTHEVLFNQAFFINGAFYLGSLLIYRYGVAAPEQPPGPHHKPRYGWTRYWKLIRQSHVWLLAPTWGMNAIREAAEALAAGGFGTELDRGADGDERGRDRASREDRPAPTPATSARRPAAASRAGLQL